MSRGKGEQRVRVGVIGLGNIGSWLCQRILDDPDCGLELAFVHTRNPARAAAFGFPHLERLERLEPYAPDVVIEAAHPAVTVAFGPSILAVADYLPLSMTALTDDGLRHQLLRAADAAGTRLLFPRGALVGAESLEQWGERWASVTITMEKPPGAIDLAEAGIDPSAITTRRVLYDGSVRGIAPLFPRNVNAMVTAALIGIGLDDTRGVLVADPGLDGGRLGILALGDDGSRLEIQRQQPMVGVSGSEMLASTWASLLAAAGLPSLHGIV